MHYSLLDMILNRTRQHLQLKTMAMPQRRNGVMFVRLIPDVRFDKLAIFAMVMFVILMPSSLEQLSTVNVKTIFQMTRRVIRDFFLLINCG